MRRCKWLRRTTINYEIPDLSNESDSLTPLVQIGLLQDSKKFLFYMKIKFSEIFFFLQSIIIG